MAKDVELVAVKVINRFGSGTSEDFVLGESSQRNILQLHTTCYMRGGG